MRKSSFTHYYMREKKLRRRSYEETDPKDRHVSPSTKCRFGGNSCPAEWYFAGLAGSRSDPSSRWHKFDLRLYPHLRSSRCDRNIIDSRELSQSVFRTGMSDKFGGVSHNNSIRIFRIHITEYSTIHGDASVLFPHTCWSSLNREIFLCNAIDVSFILEKEKRNISKAPKIIRLITNAFSKRRNLVSHLKF